MIALHDIKPLSLPQVPNRYTASLQSANHVCCSISTGERDCCIRPSLVYHLLVTDWAGPLLVCAPIGWEVLNRNTIVDRPSPAYGVISRSKSIYQACYAVLFVNLIQRPIDKRIVIAGPRACNDDTQSITPRPR